MQGATATHGWSFYSPHHSNIPNQNMLGSGVGTPATAEAMYCPATQQEHFYILDALKTTAVLFVAVHL
jgi:hypothetical protein